jgi:hypothetical protein
MEAIEIHQELKELEKYKEVFDMDWEIDYSNPVFDRDVLKAINDVVERGEFPYNRTVEEQCMKYPRLQSYEDDKLKTLVYFCQKYREYVKLNKEYQDYKESTKHYIPISDLDIEKLSKDKTRVTLHAFGKDPLICRFFIDAENKVFLFPPRNTRKGYYLHRFYKPKVEPQKNLPLKKEQLTLEI